MAAQVLLPRCELADIVPEVHRWYAPRQLLTDSVRPWYTVDTRYARDHYQRYIDKLLEGYEFYDLLGRPLNRGWLVYSWTQRQPGDRGSNVIEVPMIQARDRLSQRTGFSAYRRFFDRLVIATDQNRGGTYRLMVGDEIHTFFTPLTFFKPRFNGMRLDYATDHVSSTVLLSRISDPDGRTGDPYTRGSAGERTNSTHLVGGHLELQAGPAGHVGVTLVSAHNSQTQTQISHGNPFRGTLTTVQNRALHKLWVRVRDDSPEQGCNGAALIAWALVLVDTSGRTWRAADLRLQPRIQGGVVTAGVRVAQGADAIILEYDLSTMTGLTSAQLREVAIELIVANDYRIEMASDLQTDALGAKANPVFLTVARAPGNVQDRSNTRKLHLSYGLPTGNSIMGIDWDLVDWHGLSVQGEAVVNQQYREYPSPHVSNHHQMSPSAHAAYVQAALRRQHGRLYLEAFTMDASYSSRYWLNSRGSINYRAPIPELYEFVDDDDDHDAMPEWNRPLQPADEVAWPGYDENGDFLNDLNQNANLIPDYEEPFLRYRADRPELLPGMDMNHNGTIDRFENDDLPDYPYRKDHRGFNLYAQTEVMPGMRWSAGHQHMRLISGDGRTDAWYGLGTWVRDRPRLGRFRLFVFTALVHDDIADDLILWQQPVNAQGRMHAVPDLLPARNTWRHSVSADLDQRLSRGVRVQHRLKLDQWYQRDSDGALAQREGRRRSGFVGLVDKAEWSIPVGLATLEPRWKSEWRIKRPYSTLAPCSSSLEEIIILLWTQPLLAERTRVAYFPRYGRQRFNTQLQLGWEYSGVWMLHGERQVPGGDYRRWTAVIQLSNRVAYNGYLLITRLGVRLGGWRFADGRTQSTSLFFLTANAGLD